jgi:ATP-dependent DNA helicase RecQ
VSAREEKAFALFREEAAVEDVMHQLNLARSTILDYLAKFIQVDKPRSICPWIDEDLYQRIAGAARQVGTERLKPIFLALGQEVPYEVIRLVVAHLNARQGERGA